ncbi:MAG: alpha/beta fold hydrolase [Thermomicrobiales bacterium]
MRRWMLAVVIVVLVSAALPSVLLTASVAAADSLPRFEAGACPFRLASSQTVGKTVDCGFVVVPEQHAKPDGPTIRLAVARFRSTKADSPPDAAIFLQGGPGGGTLSTSFVRAFTTLFTPTRDFIAFDQRGTGFSEPNLDCPEVRARALRDDTQQVSVLDEQNDEIAAELACRDRLTGQGITLAAYSSAESAADINDIRAALGISYGTRLGLSVMRDFPGIVRSAVLDSVAAPQFNSYEEYAVSLDRAMNLLFANCAADARCNAAFPNLTADFSAVYSQLNTTPMTVLVKNPDDGTTDALVIDGPRLVFLVYDLLYYRAGIARIPAMVEQIKDGSQKLLQPLLADNYFSESSIGMGISVRCNEYLPFSDRDRAVAAAQTLLPEVRDSVGLDILGRFTLCPQWPTRQPDPRDHQAVTGDTPALVMESNNDPVTPPKFGQSTADALPNSFYVETPGVGHSVIGNGGACAANIVRDFINDPTARPDTACTSSLGVAYVTSR